jgi:hypothetical protein
MLVLGKSLSWNLQNAFFFVQTVIQKNTMIAIDMSVITRAYRLTLIRCRNRSGYTWVQIPPPELHSKYNKVLVVGSIPTWPTIKCPYITMEDINHVQSIPFVK